MRTITLMHLVAVIFGAATLGMPSGHAQTYPAQPIRILVGFAPGGSVDLATRAVATRVSEALGQPAVVENRPGAGGQLAVQAVLSAPADGYTLLATSSSSIVVAPHLEKLSYDPVVDLTPVAVTAFGISCIAVATASPIRSIDDLVAASKLAPGGLNYGVPGLGTHAHFVAELLKSRTGANLVAIPYSGTAPVALALVSGEVPVALSDPTSLRGQLDAGQVRLLAIANSRRSIAMPEIPTIAESGVPGFAADAWTGFLVRSGTPTGIGEKLNAEIVKALAVPEIRALLLRSGLEPTQFSFAEARRFVTEDSRKWGELIAAAKIKLN